MLFEYSSCIPAVTFQGELSCFWFGEEPSCSFACRPLHILLEALAAWRRQGCSCSWGGEGCHHQASQADERQRWRLDPEQVLPPGTHAHQNDFREEGWVEEEVGGGLVNEHLLWSSPHPCNFVFARFGADKRFRIFVDILESSSSKGYFTDQSLW